MGMKQVKMSPEHMEAIRKFISSESFEWLEEIEWNGAFQKMLLFPTEDFQLSEEQFHAVVSLMDGAERLYVLKAGYDGKIFDPSNAVHVISAPFAYAEYEKIWLDTPAILFSDAKSWIVITDELSQGGEGLFVGEEESFRRFREIYGDGRRDAAEFTEFFVSEHRQRGVPLDHLESMLKLCGEGERGNRE